MACWHRGYAWKLLQTWGAKGITEWGGSRGSPFGIPGNSLLLRVNKYAQIKQLKQSELINNDISLEIFLFFDYFLFHRAFKPIRIARYLFILNVFLLSE